MKKNLPYIIGAVIVAWWLLKNKKQQTKKTSRPTEILSVENAAAKNTGIFKPEYTAEEKIISEAFNYCQ